MYPTVTQIKDANVQRLLGWWRFLPSPRNTFQSVKIEEIGVRLAIERKKDNSAYISASKSIGW